MIKTYFRVAVLVTYWTVLTRSLVTENPWTLVSQELAAKPPVDLSFEPLSWILHLAAFGVLGGLIHWSTGSASPRLRRTLFGLAYLHAGVTEALQYFVPARWPGLMDFTFNALGIYLMQRRPRFLIRGTKDREYTIPDHDAAA